MGAGFIVSLLSGTSEPVVQWLPPAAAVRERYGLGNSRDRSLTRPPGPNARLVQSILRALPAASARMCDAPRAPRAGTLPRGHRRSRFGRPPDEPAPALRS